MRPEPPRSHRTRTVAWAVPACVAWLAGVAACAPGTRLTAVAGCLAVAYALDGPALRGARAETPGACGGEGGAEAGASWAIVDVLVAVLTSPGLAFTLPVVLRAGCLWRARQLDLSRAVAAVACGLGTGIVSVAFRACAPAAAARGPVPLAWFAAVLCAGIARGLWCAAGPRLAGCRAGEEAPPGREILRTVLVTAAAGTCLACAVAASPLCIAAAPLLGIVLRRSARYGQATAGALTDPKTGLLNIDGWQRRAEAEISRAARDGTAVAVMFADLDHFKAVNDTYGHLNGDAVLRAVAGVLRTQLREYDVAGRFGGEEFVVLLPRTGLVQARQIAERVRRVIAAAPVTLTGTGAAPVQVTISAGVASLENPGTAPGLPGLLAAADAACYQAKAAGRNRVRASAHEPGTGSGRQQIPAMNMNVPSASTLR
jgi:diguanylate cyclase (GGDEF)-like protein